MREDANNFTALRLLLAILVLLGHFRLLAGVAHPAWPFTYAQAAVDGFFVVSGYLIAGSFNRDPDLLRFYTRRVFRIYPLYLAMIVAQTIILSLLAGAPPHPSGTLRYVAANAIFANFLQPALGETLHGLAVPALNPSLWTLKIEFGFYLILPALWAGVRRFGLAFLLVLAALSACWQHLLAHAGHPDLAKQLPGQLQFFAIGMACVPLRPPLSRTAALLTAALLAVLLTILLPFRPPVLYPLVVGALVLVVALRLPAIPLRTDLSYGVYLIHGPVIQLALLSGRYRADAVGLACILAIVVALAWLAHHLIEAPAIALGRRLTARHLAARHAAA